MKGMGQYMRTRVNHHIQAGRVLSVSKGFAPKGKLIQAFFEGVGAGRSICYLLNNCCLTCLI